MSKCYTGNGGRRGQRLDRFELFFCKVADLYSGSFDSSNCFFRDLRIGICDLLTADFDGIHIDAIKLFR